MRARRSADGDARRPPAAARPRRVEEREQLVGRHGQSATSSTTRVVVGDPRPGVAPAAAEQHVALGEEHLHVAGPEVGAACTRRAQLAVVRAHERRRRRRATPSALGVGGGDEQRVAGRTGERVAVACTHRVELLAPPRAEHGTGPRASTRRRARRRRSAPARRAVGNAPPSHSRSPPHWTASPVVAQALDARVQRARPGRSRRGSPAPTSKPDEVRRGRDRTRRARSAKISHSLRASPTRGPGDLGAERDAPLGGGLGAAVALLVAGAPRAAAPRRRPGPRASGSTRRCPGARAAGPAPSASLDRRRDRAARRGSCRRSSRARRARPAPAASTISSAVMPGRGAGPGSRTSRRAAPRRSARRSATPPGNAVAYAPISAPPCTPECPRIGMRPAPGRPTLPRASARFTIAATLSAPCSCCVIPIDHTRTADGAVGVHAGEALHVGAGRARLRARDRSNDSRVELASSSCVEAGRCARARSRRSIPPSASSTFSTPLRNATSPPVCTPKNSSAICVPNIALSTLLGTQ